jgi:hypothetical protein
VCRDPGTFEGTLPSLAPLPAAPLKAAGLWVVGAPVIGAGSEVDNVDVLCIGACWEDRKLDLEVKDLDTTEAEG